MDRIDWIKQLVVAEQTMEEKGIIELEQAEQRDRRLKEETLEFMRDLKAAFIEACSAFNQLKGSQIGQIKIYGISKTVADFMLFRNGFKLIFSIKAAGQIGVRLSHVSSHHLTGTQPSDLLSEDLLNAMWGPFGELKWQYQGHQINMDYLVRHYMSRFVKESLK